MEDDRSGGGGRATFAYGNLNFSASQDLFKRLEPERGPANATHFYADREPGDKGPNDNNDKNSNRPSSSSQEPSPINVAALRERQRQLEAKLAALAQDCATTPKEAPPASNSHQATCAAPSQFPSHVSQANQASQLSQASQPVRAPLRKRFKVPAPASQVSQLSSQCSQVEARATQRRLSQQHQQQTSQKPLIQHAPAVVRRPEVWHKASSQWQGHPPSQYTCSQDSRSSRASDGGQRYTSSSGCAHTPVLYQRTTPANMAGEGGRETAVGFPSSSGTAAACRTERRARPLLSVQTPPETRTLESFFPGRAGMSVAPTFNVPGMAPTARQLGNTRNNNDDDNDRRFAATGISRDTNRHFGENNENVLMQRFKSLTANHSSSATGHLQGGGPQISSRFQVQNRDRLLGNQCPRPRWVVPGPVADSDRAQGKHAVSLLSTQAAAAVAAEEEEEGGDRPQTNVDFACGPWLAMCVQLGLPVVLAEDDPRGESHLAKHNVNVVVNGGAGTGHKVEFLAVLVQSLHFLEMGAWAKLADPSGQVEAEIHHRVLSEDGLEVTQGCVLVLRDVAVWRPPFKMKDQASHSIVVTLRNVDHVFTADEPVPTHLRPRLGHIRKSMLMEQRQHQRSQKREQQRAEEQQEVAQEERRRAAVDRQRIAAEEQRRAEQQRQLADQEQQRSVAEEQRRAEQQQRLADQEQQRSVAEEHRRAEQQRRLADQEQQRSVAEEHRRAEQQQRLADQEQQRSVAEEHRRAEQQQRLADQEQQRIAAGHQRITELPVAQEDEHIENENRGPRQQHQQQQQQQQLGPEEPGAFGDSTHHQSESRDYDDVSWLDEM